MTNQKVLVLIFSVLICTKILKAQIYQYKPLFGSDYYKDNVDLTDHNHHDSEFHNPIATNSFEALYNLYHPSKLSTGKEANKLFNIDFLAQLRKSNSPGTDFIHSLGKLDKTTGRESTCPVYTQRKWILFFVSYLLKGLSSSLKKDLLDILGNSFTREMKRCDCEASTELIFKIIYFLNFLEGTQTQKKLAKSKDSKTRDVSEAEKEPGDVEETDDDEERQDSENTEEATE